MPPVKRERRGSPSPSGDPSDMQEQGSLQGSQNPSGPSARRRRVEDPSPSPSPPGGPGGGEGPSASRSNHLSGTNAASYQEDGDWDLKHEKLDKASDMTDRLGHKIRENFKFFIRTFQSPRQVVDMKKKKGEDSDSEEDDDKRDDEKMEYTYVERVKQMVTKGKRTLIVDFRHLYGKPECANLAWWLSQFPAKVLPLLNEAVSKLCVEEYKAHGRDKDEEVWVSISSFPCSDSIRKFRNEHLNNFVTCEAVITRRTQVFNQLQNLYLTCDQCGEINGPFSAVGAESDPFKNRTCSNPDCQSRFGFTVNAERTTYQNYQRVTLQEPPGSVLAGRMPRSKDAILSGELVDTVKPGDMVQVTGIYQAQYDVELNAQTSFPVFKTEILVNHNGRDSGIEESLRGDRHQRPLDPVPGTLHPRGAPHQNRRRACHVRCGVENCAGGTQNPRRFEYSDFGRSRYGEVAIFEVRGKDDAPGGVHHRQGCFRGRFNGGGRPGSGQRRVGAGGRGDGVGGPGYLPD
ncbi:unnamed protein product [Amoebophrya sp. A120]|nr:unnamed protein product [Amoebophrya sp. A120]|eukprot:GSA120T00011043001.1